jgi:peptidyl-prolyl cis-trans isomerase C
MTTTTATSASAIDNTTELLRQAAIREGLLDAADPPSVDGVISEAATLAIETLLERVLSVPQPSDEACRRHHAAHAARYARSERVAVRHVLRRRAEACLLDVRCHDGQGGNGSEAFAKAARELSNCPSGAQGGELGWLQAADCAPEFARELFGHAEIGVLPRLVHSRFGLHVVEVLQREPGEALPFEAVRGAVEATLRQQAFVTALRQYLQVLGGADTPLVQ